MFPKRKLTPKQQLFIKNYVIDSNATKAAERAGYSKKTAYSIGQRLLKNVEVEIQREKDKVNTRVEASQEEAVRMCREIAVIDSRDYEDKRISKGIELYGRTQAAFVEKRETVHKFEGLTDAELDAKIKGIMGET